MKISTIILHILSLLVAIAGAILAYGDKWSAMPGLPEWLVHSWPLVMFAATVIDRIGKIVIDSLTPKVTTIVGLFLLCGLLGGCATNTGDPVKDARGRATNQALVEAARVLGSVATASLYNAAQQEMQNGKVNWGNAATTGLYNNSASIFNSDQVDRVISAYAGSNLPKTTTAAVSAFNSTNASPEAKTQAIASIISTAAGAPPAGGGVIADPYK
jgi:hypothetical protein